MLLNRWLTSLNGRCGFGSCHLRRRVQMLSARQVEVLEHRTLLSQTSLLVGDHWLQPNTADQVIEISVTGEDLVTGLNVRAQIGDGTGPEVEPVFSGVDFGGGIWDAYSNTVTGGPVIGAEQFLQASVVFNVSGDEVVANGLVVKLLVDTTGFDASDGPFVLLLANTQIGADTVFVLPGGGERVPDTANGTVRAQNDAPVLGAIGPQDVDEGNTFQIGLSSTDVDAGDTLRYSVSGLPEFATLTDNGNGTGTIAVSPRYTDSGSYVVTVTVTDDGVPNLNDSETFTLTVTDVDTVNVDLPSGGGRFEELRDGDDIVVRRVDGPEIWRGSSSAIRTLTINGSEDDDVRVVDLSGGNPIPHSGLTFDGMTQSAGGDRLVLANGTFTGAAYSFTNASDGSVDLAMTHSPVVTGMTGCLVGPAMTCSRARRATIGCTATRATTASSAVPAATGSGVTPGTMNSMAVTVTTACSVGEVTTH